MGLIKNKRLNTAIYSLGHKYPDLILPLRNLEFVEEYKGDQVKGLSTDGIRIFYDPRYLEQVSTETVEEEIIHIVVHGMLRHFERYRIYPDRELIGTIMDMQTAVVMSVMGMLKRYKEHNLNFVMNKICGNRYDFGLYSELIKDAKKKDEVHIYSSYLHSDDHSEWERVEEGEEIKEFWDRMLETMTGEAETDQENGEEATTFGKAAGNEKDTDSENAVQKICACVGRKAGNGRGGRTLGRKPAETEMSYEDIWRKLASLKEVAREEVDSIDPMLYHYGLELYGDIPLIEPKEVNDTYDMKSIVLAIDTSGSCANDATMQKFWSSTCKILQELSEHGLQAEIILLECDTKIQNEERKSVQEFISEVFEERQLHGGGGTDFVPVFEKIDAYISEGTEISGLIYFTDGYGRYPDEKTDYPVYFILTERDGYEDDIPEWIQKVHMSF